MRNTVRRTAGSVPPTDQITADVVLGRLMRDRRKCVGLSRKGLAKLIGITKQEIKDYEHGRLHFGLDVVILLRLALKVRIGFFSDPVTPIARKLGIVRDERPLQIR